MELLYAIAAASIVSVISLIGLLLMLGKLQNRQLFISALIAFAAGSLLADVFFHLLPEYIEEFSYSTELAASILAGITVSLLLEAYMHCSHDAHHHVHNSELEKSSNPALARLSLMSDGMHNFLDGVAIMASFMASPVIGVASTLAIILHEVPQELADTAILIHAGWSRKKALMANFAIALISIGGVLTAYLLSTVVPDLHRILIPFAAGQFIYIATADLLPEIHHKSNVFKYLVEIGMFIIGILLLWALALVAG